MAGFKDKIEQALYYMEQTRDSILLTGKAGTGKSTLCRKFLAETTKKVVALAPTGVAAMNLGGTTIHSFFKLPIQPFDVNDPELRRINYKKSERKLIEKLEVLLIDEISMVRSDVLNAMDTILRKYKNADQVFGGVQLIMVGDPYQLPPVGWQGEMKTFLNQSYPSEFFFHAPAYAELKPHAIKLDQVFRQKESPFLNVLNRVRGYLCTQQDMDFLNQKLDPEFKPKKKDLTITLCIKNVDVDAENDLRLSQLKTKLHTYKATIDGVINTNDVNAPVDLQLKVGAQVMFVKNDPEKRWVNGTLGIVKRLSEDEVKVALEDGEVMNVRRFEWEAKEYFVNDQGVIASKTKGTFEQYPIKLAWAITIHKSQGCTYDHVFLDVPFTFSPGQLYVALSRVRTFEGLKLKHPLSLSMVKRNKALDQLFQQKKEQIKKATS